MKVELTARDDVALREMLAEYAADDEAYIRLEVAKNLNTPREVCAIILKNMRRNVK
mgnify:CR=1 FL=1